MKPQHIELDGVDSAREAIDRIVNARRAEVVALASALTSRDMQALHHFRIACKRLRYAMERFCDRVPAFAAPAARLSELQDALGEAHDRDVLLTILPPTMPETERRLNDEREELVNRAAEIWRELLGDNRPFYLPNRR